MRVTVSKNEFIDYANSIGLKIISIDDDIVMEIEPAPLKAPGPVQIDPKFRHLAGGEIEPKTETNHGIRTIRMLNPGERKIGVIKAVRSITGLGLVEAKNMVDASVFSPQVVTTAVSENCQRFMQELREAGAMVELV